MCCLSLYWRRRPFSEKHLSRHFQGDVLKTATEEGKQLKKDVLKQLKVRCCNRSVQSTNQNCRNRPKPTHVASRWSVCVSVSRVSWCSHHTLPNFTIMHFTGESGDRTGPAVQDSGNDCWQTKVTGAVPPTGAHVVSAECWAMFGCC